MRNTTRFRELLDGPDLITAPGVYDAITARLALEAGFSSLYMSGAMVSAALGYPDYGLVTMTEMVQAAGVIARVSDVPVIADADTGFGNELNVTRAVREYELHGVAAIHIEDQVSPKRCGHLDGKEVISKEEYVSKIKAAVRARRDPDFSIIARTDSYGASGLSDAVERANAALEAGANIAFIEGPRTLDDITAIPRMVKGPCLLNIVQGGRTPLFDLNETKRLGYRIAIMPGAILLSSLLAIERDLAHIARTGIVPPAPEGTDVRGIFLRLGAAEWNALQEGILA